jgi:hypothetical protein
MYIVIVELEKLARFGDKAVVDMTAEERWAYFFKYGSDKTKRKEINELLRTQEAITMAATTLLTISKDENERALALSREKYALDMQSHMVQARRKGRQEVRQERDQDILQFIQSGGTMEDLITKLQAESL